MIDISVDDVKQYYDGRFFHGINHINKMLSLLQKYPIEFSDREALRVAVLFHDIVYDVGSSLNEEKSADFFTKWVSNKKINIASKQASLISKLILATKDHTFLPEDPNGNYDENYLINIMIELDFHILFEDFVSLMEWENGIFKEYQKYNLEEYVNGRTQFLQTTLEMMKKNSRFKDDNVKNIELLIKYVKTRIYKIGIYPGSFNPMHVGHLNILQKAERLSDKVIVARGYNPSKAKPAWSLPKSLPNEIIEYPTLVTELFKSINGINVEYTLIRGFRNGYDIPSEENMKKWVKEIDPLIQFIYIASDSEFEHISSSSLKDLMVFDTNLAKRFIVE